MVLYSRQATKKYRCPQAVQNMTAMPDAYSA
jgi:hypothetical protein